MADTVITEPSSSAISLTGYQRIINKLTKQSKGLAAVSFDDYADGATAPSVVAGGVYEINGTYYEVTSDTLITGMSTVSTTYYVYSTSGTWSSSTTAPEWSESKQGWYKAADANARAFFRVMTDSTGNYDDRMTLLRGGNRFLSDDTDIETNLSVGGTFDVTGASTIRGVANILDETIIYSRNPLTWNNGGSIGATGYDFSIIPTGVNLIESQNTAFDRIAANIPANGNYPFWGYYDLSGTVTPIIYLSKATSTITFKTEAGVSIATLTNGIGTTTGYVVLGFVLKFAT